MCSHVAKIHGSQVLERSSKLRSSPPSLGASAVYSTYFVSLWKGNFQAKREPKLKERQQKKMEET